MVQFIEGQLSPRSKFAQSFSQGLAKNFRETMGQFNEREESKLQLLTKQRQSEAFMQKLRGPDGSLNLTPETITQAAMYDPQLGKTLASVYKSEQKGKAEQQKAQQEHEDVSSTINALADELSRGNVGKFNKFNTLTSKGRESRAYFDELAVAIEKRLATMVGKGALNAARFDYLKKNLPSSSDTDASNKGKLRALAEEFKVAITSPAFREDLNSSSNQTNGQSQSQNQGRPPLSSYMR